MKVLIAINEEEFVKPVLNYFSQQTSIMTNMEFTVLCVVEPCVNYSYLSIHPSVLIEDLTVKRFKRASRLIQAMASSFHLRFGNVPVSERMLEGSPADIIIDTANLSGFDLVLLGSHKRHGVARILEGSVSSKVAEHAKCSVVVIPLCLACDTTIEKEADQIDAPGVSPVAGAIVQQNSIG